MKLGNITIPPGIRLRIAMAVAILADILQVAVFPMFMEGAASPPDDLLDLAVAGVLSYLIGWHWEFAPSFVGELVPGLNFVPFWTLAVANVYRKSGGIEDSTERQAPIIEGGPVRKK